MPTSTALLSAYPATDPAASDLMRRCRERLASMTSIGDDDEEDQRRQDREIDAILAEIDEAVAAMSADEPEEHEPSSDDMLDDLPAVFEDAGECGPITCLKTGKNYMTPEAANDDQERDESAPIVIPARGRVGSKCHRETIKESERDPFPAMASTAPPRTLSARSSESASSPSLPPVTTISSTSFSTTKCKSSTGKPEAGKLEKPRRAAGYVRLVRWKDCRYPRQVRAYINAMASKGLILRWSLNLGPEIEAIALAAYDGFATYIKNRIRVELAKAFPDYPFEFVFVIGQTEDGRWHLHGVINGLVPMIPGLHGALCRAGGDWSSTHHKDKQAHLDVYDPARGWPRYLWRHLPRARRNLPLRKGSKQRAIYVPREISRLAQIQHEEQHKRLSEARAGPSRAKAPPLSAASPLPRAALSESLKGYGRANRATSSHRVFTARSPSRPAVILFSTRASSSSTSSGQFVATCLSRRSPDTSPTIRY